MSGKLKYYWVLILFQRRGRDLYQPEVCYSHPFERTDYWKRENKVNELGWDDITLINWREISKSEYDTFKELN